MGLFPVLSLLCHLRVQALIGETKLKVQLSYAI